MTRRIFLHKSLFLGAAGAATYGFFPFLINTLDIAVAADRQVVQVRLDLGHAPVSEGREHKVRRKDRTGNQGSARP